jgi:hypothetical protein
MVQLTKTLINEYGHYKNCANDTQRAKVLECAVKVTRQEVAMILKEAQDAGI